MTYLTTLFRKNLQEENKRKAIIEAEGKIRNIDDQISGDDEPITNFETKTFTAAGKETNGQDDQDDLMIGSWFDDQLNLHAVNKDKLDLNIAEIEPKKSTQFRQEVDIFYFLPVLKSVSKIIYIFINRMNI